MVFIIVYFIFNVSAKRTTVIDDQMDYYSVNSGWLSSKQRGQLQKIEEDRQEKKHGSRKTKKITIDFAGKMFVNCKIIIEITCH